MSLHLLKLLLYFSHLNSLKDSLGHLNDIGVRNELSYFREEDLDPLHI